VLDAGRGEFYYGEYVGRRCLREALMREEDLRVAITGGRVVICEAKVAAALVGLEVRLVEEPSAADVLPLALERIEAGDFDDAATVDANYLRRSDAEIFAKPSIAGAGR
jgi:tRNA threonylcarbamoyladenosine biosynthesis protein TsaB